MQGEGEHHQGEAAEWLRLAGDRAKSAQDRADKARVDASWLRDMGGRALSLQGRDQARRLECAAWLQLIGGRAKSAQARADEARVDAASWLRNTAGRAISLQERAEAARSEARAWLATKGALELERTAPIVGSAAAPPTARTPATETTRRGSKDTLAGERIGQCDSPGPEKNNGLETGEGFTARGDSEPGSCDVCDPPRVDKPSIATIVDVGAEAAGKDRVRQPIVPPNDKQPRTQREAGEHTSGDRDGNVVVVKTDALPPPFQHKRSAECRIDATATAAADDASDLEYPIGHTASSDRTAPAPWLEPETTTLPCGGSLAPTAACAGDFGRMLDVGETEWSRVSLSRTPPFDALNSPSLPLRYAPVRGRPRPLPPDDESTDDVTSVLPDRKVGPTAAVVTGVASNAVEGSQWMELFAPPNQMAPKGDAYRGSDSFHSANASASTTIRADSTSSFIGPSSHCATGGTDDVVGRPKRRDYDNDTHHNVHTNDRARRCSVGGGMSDKSWGGSLGEVESPVGEAKRRIMERAGERRGCWEEKPGSLASSSRKVQGDGSGGGRRGWHKKAEQSRRYMRRWEAFLGRVHQYFDGEVSWGYSGKAIIVSS